MPQITSFLSICLKKLKGSTLITEKMLIPVSFSETAKEQILQTLNSPQIPEGYAFRVGLKGGACSASYLIGLDKPTETDEIYMIEAIKVLIDKRHLMYLIGIKIDFVETEDGAGFTLNK